jgi:glycosyltransferase involved in cell wall biosynthesis
MRVLFVLNAPVGGAALSAHDLMRGLRARGVESCVIAPPSPHVRLAEAFGDVAVETAEVFLPWWNRRYRSTWYKRPAHLVLDTVRSRARLGTVAAIAGRIRAWGVDLVHTNTALTLEGGLAARLTGRPHVWHLREQLGDDALFRFWLPEPVLARVFLGLADRVIVNSAQSRALFDRHGLGGETRLVYNGVEVGGFPDLEGAAALRARWGAPPRREPGAVPLVGMVANLTSRMKRHDVFVEAAARVAPRHPGARFVIVGTDPDREGGPAAEIAYTRELKARAARLGLGERLGFVGHAAPPAAVMGALDVLVHPCDQESFGRVAIEAMAARRPVVAADGGGLVEIVEDGATGVRVRPGDVAGFAEAIQGLLADPARAEAMGVAGRAAVEARFSLDRTVDAVMDVYRGLSRS